MRDDGGPAFPEPHLEDYRIYLPGASLLNMWAGMFVAGELGKGA